MTLPDVADARRAAADAATPDELRQARARFLGKKSELGQALRQLGKLDPDTRRARAQELQQLREAIDTVFAEREEALHAAERAARLAREQVDVTLPGRKPPAGALHPLETTTRVVLSVLRQMGFAVVEGPEIEDGFHNFDALNFPPDHPAKDMQDTFFVAPPFQDERGEPLLLRTHTSPVQIRAMQAQQPPLRVAAPGKVYRCDADVTHSPMFHQIEGFWVDRNITFRDLKGVLVELLHAVFGADVPVRFRPSFFPFTEPSAEVDIGWGDGWLEVLGCGMIHPNVLSAVGYDPGEWQGFAFGLGVERFAMLRYGIPDIRTFYESDQRVLRQLRDPLLP